MSTNVARPMLIQTYNMLPASQRKCEKGRYFAIVNGEWCSIHLERSQPEQKTVSKEDVDKANAVFQESLV